MSQNGTWETPSREEGEILRHLVSQPALLPSPPAVVISSPSPPRPECVIRNLPQKR